MKQEPSFPQPAKRMSNHAPEVQNSVEQNVQKDSPDS